MKFSLTHIFPVFPFFLFRHSAHRVLARIINWFFNFLIVFDFSQTDFWFFFTGVFFYLWFVNVLGTKAWNLTKEFLEFFYCLCSAGNLGYCKSTICSIVELRNNWSFLLLIEESDFLRYFSILLFYTYFVSFWTCFFVLIN